MTRYRLPVTWRRRVISSSGFSVLPPEGYDLARCIEDAKAAGERAVASVAGMLPGRGTRIGGSSMWKRAGSPGASAPSGTLGRCERSGACAAAGSKLTGR